MNRYAVGLDLALINDYSAVSVLQRLKPESHEPAPRWATILAERLPLGTPHPTIIGRVSQILNSLPGVTDLRRRDGQQPFCVAVDATGVGRPIFHELSRVVPTAVGVVITGGQEVHSSGSVLSVPKADLIATAQVALQHGRLKIDRNLPGSELLVHELLSFEARATAAGNLSFSARENEHDDLVLALALALWLGNRETPTNYNFRLFPARGSLPEIRAANLI